MLQEALPRPHREQFRGPEAWLCPEVKVVLESDPVRARAVAREAGATNISLENYRKSWRKYGFGEEDFRDGGSDRLIDATVGWGTQAEIEKFLQSHMDAGATQVCIQFVNPAGREAGLHWEAIEALAPSG